MNDTDRLELLRYLHERGTMTWAEQFATRWGLLVSASRRREYARMTWLHRSLAVHFAPGFLSPRPALPWGSLGVFSLLVIALIVGLLLHTGQARRESPASVTPSAALTCPSHPRSPGARTPRRTPFASVAPRGVRAPGDDCPFH